MVAASALDFENLMEWFKLGRGLRLHQCLTIVSRWSRWGWIQEQKNLQVVKGATMQRIYSESEVQRGGVGGMRGRDLWVKPTWNNISSLDKRVSESN